MVSEAPPEREAVSKKVVEALARATGTDSRNLDPPLYEAIDPEALDVFVASADQSFVEFEYDGRNVVVSADGTVSVGGTEYEPRKAPIEA